MGILLLRRGFSLSCMLTISNVFLRILDLLLHAARFTTKYVRLVGQEPAPSKCVLFKHFQGGSEGYEGMGSFPGWGSMVC